MPKPLKILPSTDAFGTLFALTEVLEGTSALYVASTQPEAQAAVEDLPEFVADEVALVVRSSGSTGRPKRIQLSAAALTASARASEVRLGGPGQWLLALPINYIAGAQVLVRSLIADTQPVLMNTQLPFTAEAFIRGASLMSEPRRYTSLVPAQLATLAQEIGNDAFLFSLMRRFDAILLGGQRPDWAVVERLRALGINIIVTYGMTETAGGCVYDGVPLDGVQLRIVEGQIEISGPTLAIGIEGWFKTNDLGSYAEGKLEVLGRADRVYVSGGLKVSLERIEEVAQQVIGVEQVVAVAIADERWGQRPALVFTGSPEAEIAAALAEAIGPEARPARTVWLPNLPMLESGKPNLAAIQELLQG